MPSREGAPKIGEQAPGLQLFDEGGKPITLARIARSRPLVALIFGGREDAAGIRLLRDYRYDTLAIWGAGARLCAIAPAPPAELRALRSESSFGFPLLSDPGGARLGPWGMRGASGVVLLDRDEVIRYRAGPDRAAPEVLLALLHRGAARRTRTRLGDRLAHFGQAIQHALRAFRPAR